MSLTALLERTNWPSAFSRALAMARWDIPPAYISTINVVSTSLVRPRAAHSLERYGSRRSPHLRELQAQNAFCGLHGANFIAITISLGSRLPLAAAPAEGLGLLLLERFLQDPFG